MERSIKSIQTNDTNTIEHDISISDADTDVISVFVCVISVWSLWSTRIRSSIKIVRRIKNRCEKNMWTCWVFLSLSNIWHIWMCFCLFVEPFGKICRSSKEITELACLVWCISTLDSMFYFICWWGTNHDITYALSDFIASKMVQKKMWNVISRNRLVRFFVYLVSQHIFFLESNVK